VTKVVCISDTHTNEPVLPWGDLLVHAGDLTGSGTLTKTIKGLDWLARQPHGCKIFVPGNHDFLFERRPDDALRLCNDRGIILLVDEEIMVCGLHVYGSPWQPRFYDWAFNLDRGPAIKAKWDLIPRDTDLLITHGPPYMILDQDLGCQDLRDAVNEIKPRLHVFGHIHEGYGVTSVPQLGYPLFVNAALCDRQNLCVNAPVVVHI
jgi:Icc-related predicted phosphoesterase